MPLQDLTKTSKNVAFKGNSNIADQPLQCIVTKKSEWLPAFKKGDRQDAKNYRLMAITSLTAVDNWTVIKSPGDIPL